MRREGGARVLDQRLPIGATSTGGRHAGLDQESERGGGDRPAGRDGGRRAAREPEPGATRTVNLGPLLVVAMLVAALAGGLWYARGRSAAPAAGDTVATVDGDPITARDVDIEFLLQRAIRSAMGMELVDDPEAVRAFRRDVLDQLVDQRLIVHAAAANGTIIDDATLDARLPTIGQSFQIQTEVLLQHATSEGITEPEFREWARRQLAIGQYLATPDAIERGQEIMTERGLPVGSLERGPGAVVGRREPAPARGRDRVLLRRPGRRPHGACGRAGSRLHAGRAGRRRREAV